MPAPINGIEAWIEARDDGSFWWFVVGQAPDCNAIDQRGYAPDATTAKFICIKAQAEYLMRHGLNQNQYHEPEVRSL